MRELHHSVIYQGVANIQEIEFHREQIKVLNRCSIWLHYLHFKIKIVNYEVIMIEKSLRGKIKCLY